MNQFELFGSPVRVSQLADQSDLLQSTREALTSEAQQTPGIVRSNMGGWHSVPDLTLRQGAPFAPLMQRIASEIDVAVHALARSRGVAVAGSIDYGMQAWAMVLGHGGYVIPHDHAEAHFSGALYIDAGDAPNDDASGRIVFTSPSSGAAAIPGLDLFPTNFSVRPETGMLLLFPGHLTHYVHPYRGHRPRVVVSFNVRLEVRVPGP